MAEPWDRQDGEPARWFDRFERYRKLGPRRTFEGAFREDTGGNGRANGRWWAEAARWRWKERAEAWDAEQVRLAREEEKQELERRRKAWKVQFQGAQAKATEALLALDPTTMSPRDILAYLVEGMKGELLARGEPTTVVENRHRDVCAEEMTDEELEAIARSANDPGSEAGPTG